MIHWADFCASGTACITQCTTVMKVPAQCYISKDQAYIWAIACGQVVPTVHGRTFKMKIIITCCVPISISTTLHLLIIQHFAAVDAAQTIERANGGRKQKELLNGLHVRVSLYEVSEEYSVLIQLFNNPNLLANLFGQQLPLFTYALLPVRNSTIEPNGAYAELIGNMAKFFNMT